MQIVAFNLKPVQATLTSYFILNVKNYHGVIYGTALCTGKMKESGSNPCMTYFQKNGQFQELALINYS